jgi:hypothetical protein
MAVAAAFLDGIASDSSFVVTSKCLALFPQCCESFDECSVSRNILVSMDRSETLAVQQKSDVERLAITISAGKAIMTYTGSSNC